MDQLIFASLSHTHYWYEVGMLKVPAAVVPVISVFNGTRVGMISSSVHSLNSETIAFIEQNDIQCRKPRAAELANLIASQRLSIHRQIVRCSRAVVITVVKYIRWTLRQSSCYRRLHPEKTAWTGEVIFFGRPEIVALGFCSVGGTVGTHAAFILREKMWCRCFRGTFRRRSENIHAPRTARRTTPRTGRKFSIKYCSARVQLSSLDGASFPVMTGGVINLLCTLSGWT